MSDNNPDVLIYLPYSTNFEGINGPKGMKTERYISGLRPLIIIFCVDFQLSYAKCLTFYRKMYSLH